MAPAPRAPQHWAVSANPSCGHSLAHLSPSLLPGRRAACLDWGQGKSSKQEGASGWTVGRAMQGCLGRPVIPTIHAWEQGTESRVRPISALQGKAELLAQHSQGRDDSQHPGSWLPPVSFTPSSRQALCSSEEELEPEPLLQEATERFWDWLLCTILTAHASICNAAQ